MLELPPSVYQVFLPKVNFCCGSPINLSVDGSTAKVYTRTGAKKAKVYKGEISFCRDKSKLVFVKVPVHLKSAANLFFHFMKNILLKT